MAKGNFTTNVRHYNRDLSFARTSMTGIFYPTRERAAGVARDVLEMEYLFGPSDGMKEVTALNVSVRGPNGRFQKWKNV